METTDDTTGQRRCWTPPRWENSSHKQGISLSNGCILLITEMLAVWSGLGQPKEAVTKRKRRTGGHPNVQEEVGSGGVVHQDAFRVECRGCNWCRWFSKLNGQTPSVQQKGETTLGGVPRRENGAKKMIEGREKDWALINKYVDNKLFCMFKKRKAKGGRRGSNTAGVTV